MDLERISNALQNYNGQEESMQQVAAVLQEELGENWTQTVFEDLKNLSPALKENLNHAYNYYAATLAWNEVQTYLNDENFTRSPEIEERLPVLKHWLDFFGTPGQEAYKSLEDRLNAATVESEDQAQSTSEQDPVSDEEIIEEESQETVEPSLDNVQSVSGKGTAAQPEEKSEEKTAEN